MTSEVLISGVQYFAPILVADQLRGRSLRAALDSTPRLVGTADIYIYIYIYIYICIYIYMAIMKNNANTQNN